MPEKRRRLRISNAPCQERLACRPHRHGSSETATPYTYRHLINKNEIRILGVNKSTESEWRYNVQHTTLAEAPHFETVSYVWGNGIRRNFLTLEDDTILLINDNLNEALPYFSLKCETGYLWIDQVCINQCSADERNHQVKIMGQIYTKGDRVLVWLNPDKPLSRCMHELIRVCDNSLRARESVSVLKDKIIAQLTIGGRHTFMELVRILNSGWFSRAWVFQEIALSRKAVFLLRHTAMPFLTLSWISRTAFSFTLSPSGKDSLGRPRRQSTLYQDNRWHTLIKGTYGYRILPVMHQSWYGISVLQGHRTALAFNRLLSRMSPISKTTDVRDLVYAFLGLQMDPEIHIEPRYTFTYEEVLVDTASSIIKGKRSLDIFEDVCRRETSEGSSVIPSWAPNWKAPLISPQLRSHGFPASERSHVWREANSLHELSVRGRVVGIVAIVFEPAFEYRTSNWSTENLHDYIALDERLARIEREVGLCSAVPSRSQLLGIITADRTPPELFEDSVAATGSTTNDLLRAYNEYLIAEKEGRGMADEYVLRGLRYYTYIANCRRIFLSDKHNFGLATCAQRLDKICILHGCSTPVILRPCGGNRFKVIENCFFKNAMHGQVVTWSEEEADTFILI